MGLRGFLSRRTDGALAEARAIAERQNLTIRALRQSLADRDNQMRALVARNGQLRAIIDNQDALMAKAFWRHPRTGNFMPKGVRP